MICLGNKFSWRRIWGSDQLLHYDSCEISCRSTAVVALKYRPESVRHGRLQRDAISPRPRMMSLLNSNELCAIKNGGNTIDFTATRVCFEVLWTETSWLLGWNDSRCRAVWE